MSQADTPTRLLCLLEIERYETLTLAAQVRYVQTLIAQTAAVRAAGRSVNGCSGLSIRLGARAGELERLAEAYEGSGEAPGGDLPGELLFGPMATLAEGYEMRALGLEQATRVAHELGRNDIATVLQRQLRQTEADGRLVLAAAVH